MVKSEIAPSQSAVEALFDKLVAQGEEVVTVSQYVTTGKRWDLTQKEVRDEVIIIHRYTDITTQYGPSYLADVDVKGEQRTLLVGGEVLMTQLAELQSHIPAVTVIRKPGRSYVFTDPTGAEVAGYAALYLQKDVPAE